MKEFLDDWFMWIAVILFIIIHMSFNAYDKYVENECMQLMKDKPASEIMALCVKHDFELSIDSKQKETK